MSHHDYATSQELSSGEPPFAALIMAAMRKADTTNAEKLRAAFPEIWDELQERYNAPGGRLTGERLAERIHSRDPQHQADDLRASLLFVHREGVRSDRIQTGLLTGHPDVLAQFHSDGPQATLLQLARFNPLVFGLVTRFHLEARTSLMGDAEAVIVHLDRLGLTFRDIGWPNSILNRDSDEAADEDPERDARLARAIEVWKTEHSND